MSSLRLVTVSLVVVVVVVVVVLLLLLLQVAEVQDPKPFSLKTPQPLINS